MIWLGLILGFIAGSVVWSIIEERQRGRIVTLEHKLQRNIELRQEAVSAVRRYESKNAALEAELKRRSMQNSRGV